MEKLNEFDIINGILKFPIVLIGIILGLILISKYKKYKNRTLAFMGITMILLIEVWFTHSIAFILVLLTGEGLSPFVFFLLAFCLIPIASVFWMLVITDLMFRKRQKLIISIYIIYAIIFEIIFLTLLFMDTSLIGKMDGPIEAHQAPFMIISNFIVLINALITGILFFLESRKSDQPELRLKGALFLIGITSFVIGSILDAFSLDLVILLIVRIILVFSAFVVYCAFTLPNWIKKIFIGEKE